MRSCLAILCCVLVSAFGIVAETAHVHLADGHSHASAGHVHGPHGHHDGHGHDHAHHHEHGDSHHESHQHAEHGHESHHHDPSPTPRLPAGQSFAYADCHDHHDVVALDAPIARTIKSDACADALCVEQARLTGISASGPPLEPFVVEDRRSRCKSPPGLRGPPA